jgi:hypothetical protein
MQELQESRTDGPPPRKYGPWLAVVGIWLLAELPTVLAPDGIEFRSLRPTGDVLALLTLAALSTRVRFGRALRWLAVAVAVTLAVVRVDRSVFFVLSRSEPLLYDQMFMVRHLFVMLSDMWGLHALPGILGVLAAAALVIYGAHSLLRLASQLLSRERVRETAIVFAVAWFAILGATFFRPSSKSRLVRWMVPEVAQNLTESMRIYHAVQQTVTHSEYTAFDRVRLVQKPDVFIFFVESYGKICAQDPELRAGWESTLGAMQQRLSAQGWNMASGLGTAPVSGGRSWLAVSSILFGTKIRYEAEFQQLTQAVGHLPTLVSFFSNRGYTTLILAPSDRARPGVQVRNDYGFDQIIAFDELDYRGPRVGFGLMPDQYALEYTEARYLAPISRPVFFAYQMVSSHADWKHVPEYVKDWHTLNRDAGTPLKITGSEIGSRLARYTRDASRGVHMGRLTSVLRERYESAILYDMRVIEDFLSRRSKDTLVIVMGDHQPPILSPETEDFSVLIHLFAKDPSLLAEFADHGFTPGMTVPADRAANVEHAGLYSLIVRALSRSRGDGSALPKYYPAGSVSASGP